MAGLMLQSEQTYNFTMISNDFIDSYMNDANGDFVKIYIYLIRCAQQLPENFSISSIADRFNLTENDVRRALLYWEKKELLKLQLDSTNEICGIQLRNTRQTKPITINPSAATVVNAYQTQTTTNAQENRKNNDNQRIQEILFLTEEYLGKPLTPDETMKIYYFYDTLHFPPDLIEHLIDYCVSNGKKSMRYIEKVALTWAEKNIRTVKQAKEEAVPYNKDYFTILKAFGIRERYPVDMEVTYMNKWLNTYHFDLTIITEACARTMKKGNQAAPFPYADTILTNWYKNGVVTKKDILALDNAHNRKLATIETASTAQPSKKVGQVNAVHKNQFTDFEQRSKSASYYDELENKLSQL